MQSGIRRDHIEQMEREISSADLEAEHKQTVMEELEESRQRQDELREQIAELTRGVERSRRNIGFDQEHFQSAISCSLQILGAPPLERVPGNNTQYRFPTLDQREGADPTWAPTMDTLRAPRSPDQRFFEWRRQSPIRPVVFEDPGTMDDETVHLHLEQRVVQRLLSRFTAQGFVHHDLSRACLTQMSDGVARVILLGRLCLYGPGAARLHEELIPITARWVDLKIRKDKLTPYARDAESRTMDLLDESLRKRAGQPADKSTVEALRGSAERDIEELLPHLQIRGEQFAADAAEKLTARAEAEAKAMQELLVLQKKRIADTARKVEDVDPKQLRLHYGDGDELRQLESNRRNWAKRLSLIDHEIEIEPERIRELYKVKAKRIEPVGLVYLWPAG